MIPGSIGTPAAKTTPTPLEDLATLWQNANLCTQPNCVACKAAREAYERLRDSFLSLEVQT